MPRRRPDVSLWTESSRQHARRVKACKNGEKTGANDAADSPAKDAFNLPSSHLRPRWRQTAFH
ncbi:hypothetical protein J1605_020625 [Eschrichtius robustus]|uniref:Uncharacterized protein n=1 Tax=Eschrichtius robustus TaxID=9764 RepID=A0AB34HIU8_ESCRO|nr:hypothetical protein J1605_020625 [Eschrichtius robustus]